jgi:hypothetical protein
MKKSKYEFKIIKEDLIPLLFLVGLILFIGLVMLGGMASLDLIANTYCMENINNTSECSILNKESH